ncbi:hypothetical protein GQ473_05385 [archaeon]|nr:hypothetical protein [archaeon]
MARKKIKINTNVKFAIKIIASIALTYALFEKNQLNVSIFIIILTGITWILKKDKKAKKNQRIVERVCDIFVFVGFSFSGGTSLTIGFISFIVIVFLGYTPYLWAKRAHLPRYFILTGAFLSQYILHITLINEAIIACILITLFFSIKNVIQTKYIFK